MTAWTTLSTQTWIPLDNESWIVNSSSTFHTADEQTNVTLQYQPQHVGSMAVQFLGACLVGVLGSAYTIKAVRKIGRNHKILHKYLPIPNLLLASFLVCGLMVPLRMFTSIMVLAGEDVDNLCLAVLYLEQLCDAAGYISIITLALHRLRGVYRKVFNTQSDSNPRPSRIIIGLSWLLPVLVLPVYTYIGATVTVPPRTQSICTHMFPQGGMIPQGAAILVDISLPVAASATLALIAVAYTAIVCQMRAKTQSIRPLNSPAAYGHSSSARKYSLTVQRLNIKKSPSKTVSWSSVAKREAPEARDARDIHSQPNQANNHTMCEVTIEDVPTMSDLKEGSGSQEPKSSHKAQKRKSSTSSNYSVREGLRKTSILSLVRVSTIPEMRSEEDNAMNGSRKSSNSQTVCSSAMGFTAFPIVEYIGSDTSNLSKHTSIVHYPIHRRHQLPPVQLPKKNRRNGLRKKKWHKKKGQQRAIDATSVTSPEAWSKSDFSFCSTESSNSAHIKRTRQLRRQKAITDDCVSVTTYEKDEMEAASNLNDLNIGMEESKRYTLPSIHAQSPKAQTSQRHKSAPNQNTRHNSPVSPASYVTHSENDDVQVPGMVTDSENKNTVSDNTNTRDLTCSTAKEISDCTDAENQRRKRSSQFQDKTQNIANGLTSLDQLENEIIAADVKTVPVHELKYMGMTDQITIDENTPRSSGDYSKHESDIDHDKTPDKFSSVSWGHSTGSLSERLKLQNLDAICLKHQKNGGDSMSQAKSVSNQESFKSPQRSLNNFSFGQITQASNSSRNSPNKVQNNDHKMLPLVRRGNTVQPIDDPEGQGDAPQIRIIRPSTDTLKRSVAAPSRSGIARLAASRKRAPMSTISSESEYDMYAGTKYSTDASFSSVSLEQRQSSSQSNYSTSRWARRRSTLLSQRLSQYRTSSIFSRQFSLASIWSNIPKLGTGKSSHPEVSASSVFKRSLLIVGTFLLTQLPVAVIHACIYWISPHMLVNLYPIMKLLQQVNFALSSYIYVFSNQRIRKDLAQQAEPDTS